MVAPPLIQFKIAETRKMSRENRVRKLRNDYQLFEPDYCHTKMPAENINLYSEVYNAAGMDAVWRKPQGGFRSRQPDQVPTTVGF